MTIDQDREDFIKRLLRVERDSGEDLRITDLKLRYQLRSITEDLPHGNQGRILCQGDQLPNPSSFDMAFARLLACVPTIQASEELMSSRQYEQIMENWREHFIRHLEHRSSHKLHKNGLYFIGLQRWNSSSPAQGRSVGGGYLLYKTDKYGAVDLGVAIDPGFDFLRNFFHMGFSLSDIDFILISHAHADHIRDFESIAIMLHELRKRREGKKKTVHVILTLGAYKRLEHIIKDPTFRFFIDPYIIDVHKEIDLDYFENLDRYTFHFENQTGTNTTSSPRYSPQIRCNRNTVLSICPTRAYHDDKSSYSDSFGFLINVNLVNDDKVSIGYTGDTKWVYPEIPDPLDRERIIRDISTQYKDCDTVVVHLGSLIDIDKKKFFKDYDQCRESDNTVCEELIQKKEHPYIVGLLRMLSSLYGYRKPSSKGQQLILISEYGEELGGGIRKDLVQRLKRAYDRHLVFLPLDVGIDVQLWPKAEYQDIKRCPVQKVWCVQCERFVDIEEADFERYGVDEALFCVCKTCRKATSPDVLQLRLRRLYEEGRELKSHEGE